MLILDLKAVQIIGQRKAFYRQRIAESSCARKEIVDIDAFLTSRNGDRKVMQSIRITRQAYLENKEGEPVQPVQINIYHNNPYRKDLIWKAGYISTMSQEFKKGSN